MNQFNRQHINDLNRKLTQNHCWSASWIWLAVVSLPSPSEARRNTWNPSAFPFPYLLCRKNVLNSEQNFIHFEAQFTARFMHVLSWQQPGKNLWYEPDVVIACESGGYCRREESRETVGRTNNSFWWHLMATGKSAISQRARETVDGCGKARTGSIEFIRCCFWWSFQSRRREKNISNPCKETDLVT